MKLYFFNACSAVLLFLVAPPLMAEDGCSLLDDANSKEYDLRPLIKNEGSDWEVKDADRTYYINVCRKILHSPKDISNTDAVGAYYEAENTDGYLQGYSIGSWNSKPVLRSDKKKLILQYGAGSPCPSQSNMDRSTIISFVCNQNLYNKEGEILFVGHANECTYVFEWTTAYACPINKSSSHFTFIGVFGTIVAVAVLVYIIGGVIYNRVVKNQTGWKQIPNYDTWENALDFIKDIIIISVMSLGNIFKRKTSNIRIGSTANNGSARPSGFSRGFGRRGGGGYHDINQAPDEAEEDLLGISEEH